MLNIPAPIISNILNEAIAIQQIPAPTFAERERALYVKERFYQIGLQDVTMDPMCNVFARRPGGSHNPLLVTAHLDTVFPAHTDLTITRDEQKIAGPGIGDNSLAVATLIGLQQYFTENNIALPYDLHLVANVCEEGLGNLKGMHEVMRVLGDKVAATIVLEGGGANWLCHQAVGSQRYRITVQADGGHSWGDFGNASAIHTLIQLAHPLTQLSPPALPKTTFNIGIMEGGTSINSIAQEASLLLDLRSESQDILAKFAAEVERMIDQFPAKDATIHYEVIGKRPAGNLDPHHLLVSTCTDIMQQIHQSPPHIKAASTDANVPLSLGYPAVCLGLTNVVNAHRLDEYIEIPPFIKGFQQLIQILQAYPQ